MSAATLRAPARWTDAVRAELGILASVRPWGWIGFFLLMSFSFGTQMNDLREDVPFWPFRLMAILMFLLPLAWQGRGARERYVPLPIGDAARETARVFCGAACAGAILGAGIALYARSFNAEWARLDEAASPMDVFSRTYPVALTVAGIASYLFGAALMLRVERPGRTLTAVFLLAILAFAVTGIQPERVEFEYVSSYPEPVRFEGGSSLTLAASLLWLTAGAVAVGLSAWLGSVSAPRRQPWPRRRPPRERALARPRPAVTVPHAPASPGVVFARHVRLLAPRMVMPMLLLACLAWVAAPGELTAEVEGRRVLSSESFAILWFAAFLWPALVWMDEQRTRPWDEAHPAGIPLRRMLHAAAGMVWLQAAGFVVATAYVARAVKAGLLASPAEAPAWLWLGLPLALTAVYSLGTVLVVLGDRPILSGIFATVYLPFLMVVLSGLLEAAMGTEEAMEEALEHPVLMRPFAPLADWGGLDRWSAPGALLCALLCAAAGAWAIARRARKDRTYDGLPVREPRPFIPLPWRVWWAARGRTA